MKQTHSLGTRLLAVVLCIIMVLGMLPPTEVHAESLMVAQIGDVQYATLAEALAAVPDGEGAANTTITLLKNTSFSFDLGNSTGTAPQNLVLDLNGKELKLVEAVGSNGTKSSGIRVLANSSLTIRNGEIVCSSDAADNIKVGIANYGTLELDSVRLYSGDLTMYGINNRGTLTLKGSTEVYNSSGVAVTNDPYNLVYTNRDAVYNAGSGVYVESIQVERYKRSSTNAGGVVVNITGGTYGKFVEDGTNAVPVTYNVSGATIQVVDSKQLKQAVTMAPASGTITVMMTADIATSFDLGNGNGTAPQNLILDMNGKKLTLVEAVGSAGTKSSGIRVLANSSLIVRNGEIVCSSDAADNIKVGIANYGTLELDSVKLYSGDLTMYGINNRGTLALKGSTEVYNSNGVAVTNDPYNLVYTGRDAEFNAEAGVYVESVLVERYKRSTTNAGGVVVNITGGTYGKFVEDGTGAVPVTYNVSGATIRVADGAQLRQAVAMAPASGSVTVEMTADIATSFDLGNSTGTAPQNLILDMNGKKLTLVEAVGSDGTKSSGIRVLANSTLSIRNGAIVCSSDAADNIKVGIANYGTLEMDSVKLSSGDLTMYGINNRGTLTLKGSTEIHDANGARFVAAVTNDPYNLVYTDRDAEFNCYDSNVVAGSLLVERYARNTPNAGGVVLNITAGAFGRLSDDGKTAMSSVYNITGGTFGNNIDAFLDPEDYECIETEAGFVVTFIKKMQAGLSFADVGPVERTYEEGLTFRNLATGGTVSDSSVTYAIIEDGSTPGAATVDATTGVVTVLKAGTVIVEATKAGNDIYLDATARYELKILPAERTASFGEDSVEVTYGTRTYSNDTLKISAQSKGTELVYSLVSGGDIASVDSQTGRLTFLDQRVGTVEVKVVASGDDCYSDCEATYKVSVGWLMLPEDVNWVITGDTGSNGWYKSTVTLTAPEGYVVGASNSMDSADWAESIDFATEGTHSKILYMKDIEGHITDAMPFEVKIDRTAPGAMVKYVEAEHTTWFDWLGGKIFGTNEQAEIVFHVTGNDIALVEWSKDDGQSYEVLWAEDGVYSVTIDPEYRGHVRARVTDEAGWTVVTQEDGVLVLVDQIRPNLSANFREENGEAVDSFPRDDEDFMNSSAEAFYLDFVLTDNNYDLTTIVVSIDRANGLDQETVDLEWIDAEDGNSATATLALTERDEYIITADFQDPVNKDTRTYKVRLYNSEPELKAESLNADAVVNTIGEVDYYQSEAGVTMQLSVSDDFFDQGESGVIVNGERQPIALESWEYDGQIGVHTTVLTYQAEGSYEVRAFYNTPWNGEQTSEVYSFVLDTTAPDVPSLAYKEISVWESFFGKMFGFHNGELTVTVENVVDNLSDVGKVEFSLDGGDSYKEVAASDEGYVFTVAPEYRGQITVKVTDNARNFRTLGESRIVVLDNTNPKIEVEFKGRGTEENDPLLNASSSDPEFSVVFKIIETNLDVAPEQPKVYFKLASANEWEEGNAVFSDDNHTVEFPMTVVNGITDGIYQVKLVVKDHFSTVEETVAVKIDRTAPDIMAQMAAANNTQDGWAYYNSADNLVMDIEITEENFNANNVTVKVLRNGEEVASYAEYAKVNTNWMKSGKRNTARLTFADEGAYEVTITCTDTLGTAAKPTGTEGSAVVRKFVIDRTKPEASITYNDELTLIETLKGLFLFGRETIKANLNADDALAGVNTVLVSIDGENFEEVPKIDGKYGRTVEERGILTLKVMDKAGNETVVLEDRALVVDKSVPGITTVMENDSFEQYGDGPLYTNHDPFEFTMKVTDEDTYDLFAGKTVVLDNGAAMDLVWTSDETETSGQASIRVTGEGQHEMTASINTGLNEAAWKKTVIVDTILPGIEIAVTGEMVQEHNGFDYYGTVPSVTVTIDEVNFNAGEVVLEMVTSKVALDENGEPLELPDYAGYAKDPANWKVVPGTNQYVLTLDVSADAMYELTVNYTDLATNAAKTKSAKFVVDTTAPSVDTVTYSKNAVEVLLEEISFGFFKAGVNVQITTSDRTAGVQSVEYWIEGTVGKNDETSVTENGILEADKNGEFDVFSLPADFYGRVYTQARDYSGHLSERTNVAADADGGDMLEMVVVDADAPVLTPSLNQAANEVGGVRYYNAQYPAGLTITVEEANFYEELFAINATVNAMNHAGKAEDGYEIAPWNHNTTTHTQTVTMSGDAEYWFTLTGEDRSGNRMEPYITPVMILDTIAPLIDVKLYAADDQGIFDMTQQAEGKSYENEDKSITTYYDSAIKAVITITERNFDAEQVKIDVSGVNPLNDALSFAIDPAKWRDDGDTHTYELFFDVDGTYALAVGYTDLAKNAGVPFEEVKFDVDNANPDILVEGIVDGSFNKESLTVTIKITDANFNPDAEHLTYSITSTNATGMDMKVGFPDLHNPSNWIKTIVEDKVQWSAVLKFEVEANYTISLSYTDMSGRVGFVHESESVTKYTSAFTVDSTIPEGLIIEYSERSNEIDGIYYYKAPATLTLIAMDGIAGLEKFVLHVTSEGLTEATTIDVPNGAEIIDTNSELADFKLKSVENADGKMVVVLEIPAEFNGRVGFTAQDNAGNYLNVTDLAHNLGVDAEQVKTIVVDTIAPALTAETAPTQILDAKTQETVELPEDSCTADMTDVVLYYADKAEYKFTMTEANFFADEVFFTVNGQPEVLNWTSSAEEPEVYEAVWTSSEDGDYVLSLSYTDRSGNVTAAYESQRIVVDTKAPVMTVVFENDPEIKKNTDARDYYNAERFAVITIVDENFRPADVEILVEAKDVTNNDIGKMSDEYKNRGKTQNENGSDEQKWSDYETDWRRADDTYTIVIPFATDANYTFSVSYKDLVLKEAEVFTAKAFTVDKTDPTDLTMTYAVSPIEVIKEGISFGFYDAQLDVTVTAQDATSGIDHFVYSYINLEGVSSVNAELLNEALSVAKYSSDNMTATAYFTIPKSALGRSNQFDGKVQFDAFDRSSNQNHHDGERGVVVDNISPTASVSFNEPVQTVNGTEYYNGAINGRIVINEANFYSSDVEVVITRDGVRYDTRVNWKDNSVDEHVGTFTLSQEGDYIVTINYTDKSNNKMAEYKSATKVIDLAAPSIHVSNVVADSANDVDVYTFTITVEDADSNLRTEDIKPSLTGIFRNADGIHTTKAIDLGDARVVASGKTFTYTVQDLPEDGIYTLACSAADLARNRSDAIVLEDGTTASTVRFSINRNGSTFAYGNEPTRVLAENYFVQSVGQDLVIHEINVDTINTYTVMLNGLKLTEGVDYTTTLTGGGDKWSLREYVIHADLFSGEGEYRVVVSSVDATNATAYSDMRNLNMSFVVDITEPSIIIGGLENEGRYQTEEQIVTMYPSDEGGSLQSVKIVLYANNAIPGEDEPKGILFEMSGEQLQDYLMKNGGRIEFKVPDGYRQSVQITCTDYAVDADGNVNTYVETLKDITVSPSGFMMFFADKPLFYGTIGSSSAILALILFLVVKKKKKEETSAAE